ncbi:isoprenylcysteine carboxyl methyltransferase [Pleurocapsales cyanobacterium LEGE 06147]|nr:isoprenylcysteine carboxyl methyltransferase [Pleurocapsales cyanobacterium LEGE 06147]
MPTQALFVSIIIAVILQRLFELRLSQRNAAYILARGGRKHGDNFLAIVKVLQISWWIAMLVEVFWLERPFIPILAAGALLATVAGQILRYLSMQALGRRWTLPIITIPDVPVVEDGIYSYLQHPNWLGVILEIAALPLIHGAYLTAIFFSIANAFLMGKRLQAEELALIQDTNYADVFSGRLGFHPSLTKSKQVRKALSRKRVN